MQNCPRTSQKEWRGKPPAKLFLNKRFSSYSWLPLPVCLSLLHSSWLFCSQLDIYYRESLHTCAPTILLPHCPLSILLIATFAKCLDPCPMLWSHVNRVWYSNNDDDGRLHCSPLSSFKYSSSLLATALLTIPYVILTCTNGGFFTLLAAWLRPLCQRGDLCWGIITHSGKNRHTLDSKL